MFFQWPAINLDAVATRTNSRFFGLEGGEALFFPRGSAKATGSAVPTSEASGFFLLLSVVITATESGGRFDKQQ